MADVRFDADAKVDELLDDVAVRLPSAAEVRARGGRRQTRRRAAGVAAAVAVAAAGALTWAAVPGGSDGPGREVRPAASPHGSAIVVDGMPRILMPDQLPEDARWNWKAMDDGTEDSPLPRIARGSTCPDSYRERKTPDHVQYSATYYSEADEGHASASHRIVAYDTPAAADRELRAYQDELTSCGLTPTTGRKPHWSGTANGDGSRLRVTAERSGKWVSVVEVRVEAP
ncbi:hypothetical protein [Streptomyces lasiicapitis]|uniref:hypothetical protein n=1 Tax=Streptomyces lasiicapitis TaxID=1923961 RepID=UPI0036695B6D